MKTFLRLLAIFVCGLLILYATFMIGMHFGREVGVSDYHMSITRPIHVEAFKLDQELKAGDIEAAKKSSERVMLLLGAAGGDKEKFNRALRKLDSD